MQLFVFAPLIGYLLYRFGYFMVAMIGVLIAVCVGWTYWLYEHFNIVNQLLNIKYGIDLSIQNEDIRSLCNRVFHSLLPKLPINLE